MHNTAKHAAAGELRVSMVCSDEEIVPEIRDNGKGFDTAGFSPVTLVCARCGSEWSAWVEC